jgi:hypothetical protein
MIDLHDTSVRFAPEDYERFTAHLEGPIRKMPPKMRERLSQIAPWDENKPEGRATKLAADKLKNI